MKNEPKWIEHDGSSVCPVPAGHDVEVNWKDRGAIVCRAIGGEIPWRLVRAYRDWTAFEQQREWLRASFAEEHQAKAAPRLLTEAEWVAMLGPTAFKMKEHRLRERGLIAPESVDRLREVVDAMYQATLQEAESRNQIIDEMLAVLRARLPALRRGMELAPRKELTREIVEHAVRPSVTLVSGGGGCLCEVTIDYPTIYAALRDAIEGEG